MKNHLYPLLLVCLFALNGHSQTQDLIALSQGEYVAFNVLIDSNDDVYGYLGIYLMDEVDKSNRSFETVLLDRNLNKVSNFEFLAANYVSSFRTYVNFNDQIIFVPYSYSSYSGRNYKYDEMLEVDFKKKETRPYMFQCHDENGEFIDCEIYRTRKDKKKELKEKGYVYDSDVYQLKKDRHLILERKLHKNYYNDATVKVYDEEKNLDWEWNIDSNGSKKKFKNVAAFWKNIKGSDNIYVVVSEYEKKHASQKYLAVSRESDGPKHWSRMIGYNAVTGEELMNEDITDKYSYAKEVLSRTETEEDLIEVRVLTNRGGLQIGYRRTKISLTDHTITWDDLLFEDMADKIERLNRYGLIGGNYELNPIASFANSDGSVYILTEEFKIGKRLMGGTVSKNKDFLLIRTDSEFRVHNVDRIAKEKSKYAYTDFLFWQKLNDDNNDVAFF